uniref:Uncharacterized protein n=1 Tax=Oncorhynchus kisutch TaxID=8019 RepID=A0A8C7N680_ONCKI
TSGIVAVIIVLAQHINAADVCPPDNIRLIPSSSFAVHKLITYSFHHQTETQILLSIGVLVLLCGGIEKTVGTVWFLLMFQLLSINTGVLYTTLGLVLFGASAQNQVEGLVPVSPSLMGMATVYSLMVKAMAWLFLVIVTLLVPHSLPLGWHPLLDMSDARASVLDKKMPFSTLLPRFVSPFNDTSGGDKNAISEWGGGGCLPVPSESCWAQSYYTQGSPVEFSGYYVHNHGYALKHSFGHSQGHGHSHGHSHWQTSASQTSSHWAPVAQHLHSQHSLQSVCQCPPEFHSKHARVCDGSPRGTGVFIDRLIT